uniref:Tc1-like transposase DDE domain-containing protein n=1 Tax=Trichuris muris TaxID=70415 RepID=A0A5S6QQ13_TRIMR
MNKNESPKHFPKPKVHQKKVMVSVWWTTAGVVHYKVFGTGETVTSGNYCNEIEIMQQKLQQMRPALVNRIEPVLFLDNARPYVEQKTVKELNGLGIHPGRVRETRRYKAEEAVTVDGACPGGDGGKGEGQRYAVVDQRKPSAGAAAGSSRLLCRPPPCFSPDTDVDIWLSRLNDYLEPNDVPEAKWMAVFKSFVNDEVYSVLAEEGPMATFGELTTCLKRRNGPGRVTVGDLDAFHS